MLICFQHNINRRFSRVDKLFDIGCIPDIVLVIRNDYRHTHLSACKINKENHLINRHLKPPEKAAFLLPGFVFVGEAFRLPFLFARMISLFMGRRGAVPYRS